MINSDLNSLIPGADILEDFHFIPDYKSTTLVYKFGSSTEHSPYDEGLTTMGAGTAIYYFTATGTLGTIYAFAAGDQKAFLKKYKNGTWSNWVALVSNADLEFHEAAKITLGRYNSYGTTVINIDSTDGEEYQLVASDQDLKYQKKIKNSSGYNTIWSITP